MQALSEAPCSRFSSSKLVFKMLALVEGIELESPISQSCARSNGVHSSVLAYPRPFPFPKECNSPDVAKECAQGEKPGLHGLRYSRQAGKLPCSLSTFGLRLQLEPGENKAMDFSLRPREPKQYVNDAGDPTALSTNSSRTVIPAVPTGSSKEPLTRRKKGCCDHWQRAPGEAADLQKAVPSVVSTSSGDECELVRLTLLECFFVFCFFSFLFPIR